MMKVSRWFFLAVILAASFPTFSRAQTAGEGGGMLEGSVFLPEQSPSSAYETLIRQAQERGNASAQLASFRERHGAWNAFWDEWTGTPYRLFGQGFNISSGDPITAENVERYSRAAIAECIELLGCPDADLALVSSNEYEGKWNVLFTQVYKGVPVYASDVIVRLNADGMVPMVGSQYYKNIDVVTTPTLTAADAQTAALKGLVIDNQYPLTFTPQGLCIFPYRTLSGITYHLAYQMTIDADPLHVWNAWVDAHNGAVLWRWNQVRDGIDGNVTGSVRLSSVVDPPTISLMPDLTVKVNGNPTTTDAAGYFTSTSSGTVVATLAGPYAKVSRQNGSNASITMNVANGGTAVISWTNSNSQPEERSAFYNVVRAHRYLKTLDAGVTGMDYQVIAKVNVAGTCNAFWDGTNLNFYLNGTTTQGTCPNPAEMPDVCFHEYGHGVNDKLYKQLGKTAGMTNAALHEGLADANSAMILDRSEMGVGFWGPGTILRDNNNTKHYPEDIVGESHADGEILAGACWEMRKNLPLNVTEHDVHYAKRGLPDDANTGKAYVKYFLEVLRADDNDGNLANGTPHSAQIVPAFGLHGIPAGMLTVVHTPVENAAAGAPIPLTVSVTTPMTELGAGSVQIYYQVGSTGVWLQAPMSQTGGNIHATSNWTGSIPAQQAGSIIQYYLMVTETYGGTLTYTAKGAASPFTVLVGFSTLQKWDFETAAGWYDDQGDDASTGNWIDAVPVASLVNTITVQPGSDHSTTGSKCWVTGNAPAGADAGTNDVDNGTTTLYSPTFSLAGYGQPVLRYYSWYTNNMGANPGTDTWQVQISNDDGNSWIDIENTSDSYLEWRGHIVPVSTFVVPTATMKLRFIASDADPQSLVEAAVDDVELLYIQTVPVELATLSAARNGGSIQVSWSTESEQNNAGFVVEYQTVGDNAWTAAGFVPGHQTTMTGRDYAFAFDERSGRNVLVRLKQMDLDGSVNYSASVEVLQGATDFALDQNYPNPFSGGTTVSFMLAEDGPAVLTVRNILGVTVETREFAMLSKGQHLLHLGMAGHPAGLYQFELRANGRAAVRTMTLR